MLRSFDNLDRDHQGLRHGAGTARGDRDRLPSFPGRKTIVFFSEGLPVSPDPFGQARSRDRRRQPRERHGLRGRREWPAVPRARSTNTRKEMDVVRRRADESGRDRLQSDRPAADDGVRAGRGHDEAGLARGPGAAVRGHRRVPGRGVEQSRRGVQADRRGQPVPLPPHATRRRTRSSDGKFRAIQVKVHRPGTQVFARKGYRAIGSPRPVDAGDYETPALAAARPHAAAERVPGPRRRVQFSRSLAPGPDAGRSSTLAPTRCSFNVDRQRSTYSAQVAVVVRLRDAQGREVQKVSQQYVLAGEAKDVDAAKQGEILFYREADLPPGVYTMETIVFDAIAQRGSARLSTLTVAPAEPSRLVDEQPDPRQPGRGSWRLDQRHDPALRRSLTPLPESRRADSKVVDRLSCPSTSRSTATSRSRRHTRSADAQRSGDSPKHQSRRPRKPVHGCSRSAGCRLAALPDGTYELRDQGHRRLDARLSRSAFFTFVGLTGLSAEIQRTANDDLHPDVDPRRHRFFDREVADDDVEASVAVDVADIERRVPR